MSAWLRTRYGAPAWHLVLHLAGIGVIAYALTQVLRGPTAERIAIWLLAGAVVHDLLLLPLYSLADALVRLTLRRPRLIDHLRAPAAISAVLLLVFFPLILVKADGNFVRATGHHVRGYALSWALITVGLFAASALHYRLTSRSRVDQLEHPSGPPRDEHPPAA
jgi:hypothetical protein